MAEQLELVPSEPKLTDRQRYVLELVELNGGATATHIGLVLHARRGKHDGRRPCSYCEDEGRAVLVALRRKGLVVRRRSGRWESLRGGVWGPATPSSSSAQTNEIPF
jgi:hypothetical protein